MIKHKLSEGAIYILDRLPKGELDSLREELNAELLRIFLSYGLSEDVMESFNEDLVLKIERDDDHNN